MRHCALFVAATEDEYDAISDPGAESNRASIRFAESLARSHRVVQAAPILLIFFGDIFLPGIERQKIDTLNSLAES